MNLTHLDLSHKVVYTDSNKIRAEGCLYLSRANWKKLTQLDLGSIILTEVIIILGMRAVSI
jgi:hypothetical protein